MNPDQANTPNEQDKRTVSETLSFDRDPLEGVSKRKSEGFQCTPIRMIRVEYEVDGQLASKAIYPEEVVSFGRNGRSECVVASDPFLSARHFLIACLDREAILRDPESTNGTLLNGERATEKKLRHGDQILAGMTVFTVKFTYS